MFQFYSHFQSKTFSCTAELLDSTKRRAIKLSLRFPLSQLAETPLSSASSPSCSCPDGNARRMGIIWRWISQNSFCTLNLTFILVLLSFLSRFFVARNLRKPPNQPCSPPTTENKGFETQRAVLQFESFLLLQTKPKVAIKSKTQNIFLPISRLIFLLKDNFSEKCEECNRNHGTY
jgi:hypothetical protein